MPLGAVNPQHSGAGESYADEVLADSPVVYFVLDEGEGVCADSSPHDNAGTYTTTTSQVDDSPVTGVTTCTAIPTGGSHGWINSAEETIYEVGDVFTLECWIKTTTDDAEQGLIDFGDNCAEMRISSANKVEIIVAQTQLIAVSTVTVTDGDWHYIAWTKNGAANHIYVDGADVTGAVTNATCDAANAFRATYELLNQNPYAGLIAQLAVYATALSSARISAHFAAA
jgi:Concanavalin A-like lectin/glucanases superfamily